MKIEVGKRYVRRDGVVTDKIYFAENSLLPGFCYWNVEVGSCNSYNDKGQYYEDGTESALDLVSEYIEPEKEKAVQENRKEIYEHLNIAGAQAANLAGKGYRNFGAHHSLHEGYAVLAEEVDELWDLVKMKAEKREPQKIYEEALDIAAMALRIAVEFGYEK